MTHLARVLQKDEAGLLADWVREQAGAASRHGMITREELDRESRTFLRVFSEALSAGAPSDIAAEPWAAVKEKLAEISRTRTIQGFSPSETATFVFSLKRPLFERIQKELPADPASVLTELWRTTELLDALGLFTVQVHQKTREEVISRQGEELLELSTPVVSLWRGILALPLIGTLDSARTQVVMQSLLDKIVETGSDIAIIDITGVPTVDTLVAQHLLKTVSAARLMGAECIISGIRPQIAQTIVHLGVDLGSVTTKGSLADAFAVAMQKRGLTVLRVPKSPGANMTAAPDSFGKA